MKKLNQILNIEDIKRISYRNDINGLRAIAVLSVVFYHADFGLFQGGWLGVDIFFVISGFLISNIIISNLNNNVFLFRDFYQRRLRRIIPALISTIMLSIPLAYLLLTPRALIEFVNSALSSTFFYSNYYFENLDFYNAPSTKVMPLLHTWTLSLEEQFYIFFPLVCFVIYKVNKKFIPIIFILSILISLYLNSTTSELSKFYLLQFRIWELILGSLAMYLSFKISIKHLEKIGFTLIVFSILYFENTMISLNSIEPKIIATFGTFLFLLSDNNKVYNKIPLSKFLTLIGLSSYSIYLLHQPLFAFYRIFLYRNNIERVFFTDFIIFLILFTLSYLSWRFVEKFFQKSNLRVLIYFICLGLVIILLFTILTYESDGLKNRYKYVPESVLFYSNNPNIYPNSYKNESYIFQNKNCNNFLIESRYCTWSNKNAETTLFLVGDSHTNSLSVSFLEELDLIKNDVQITFFSGRIGRCLLSRQSDTLGEVAECSEIYFEEFLNLINPERDFVIAFGRFDTWLGEKGAKEIKCDNCDYLKEFSNRLSVISENSKHLIIIEPIPTYSFGIADSYLYKRTTWGNPITQNLKSWEDKVQKFDIFIHNLKINNLIKLKTIPMFCDTNINICYASTENLLYYSDSNHLTLEGAKLISTEIEKLILNLK